MSTVAFEDANGILRYLDVVGTGTTNDPYVLNFSALNELAASDYNQSTAGLIGLLRLLGNTFGSTSETVNGDGSLMARMRLFTKSISSPNIFTRYQAAVSSIINASPCYFVAGWAHNRNGTIRYLQLFDRTTLPTTGNVPLVSFPLPNNTVTKISTTDYSGGSSTGILFPTGLVWGFSTTEGTYTAGANADVSTTLFWRPS